MPDKVKETLRNLSKAELVKKIDEYRRELFGLRLNAATSHVKDYSRFKKLKKAIAQSLTFVSQQNENDTQSSKNI